MIIEAGRPEVSTLVASNFKVVREDDMKLDKLTEIKVFFSGNPTPVKPRRPRLQARYRYRCLMEVIISSASLPTTNQLEPESLFSELINSSVFSKDGCG